jgi:hypothetical protein
MFTPKCYTLINKLYDPTKDIRNVRDKILNWFDKIKQADEDDFNKVLANINKYINSIEFPVNNMNMPLYDDTVEGWKLMRLQNNLEEKYPRQFNLVILEEKKERRERSRMMNEDDESKL